MAQIAIAVHGGAGTLDRAALTAEKESAYKAALSMSVRRGHGVLAAGGSSLDAVEAAVRVLEDSPLFNAGRGSVFTAEGTHEMDAAVMQGSDLRAGAVAGVQHVKNPVTLARLVMEKSNHVLVSGRGAFEFAYRNKLQLEDDAYFFDQFRYDQWQEVKGSGEVRLDHNAGERKFGTVGAVARDAQGNLAAATSTGGMTNKRWGRIGDSPVIGAGTYASNATCAISCTGNGEAFLRAVAAHDVHALMAYKSLSLQEAVRIVVHEKLPALDGEGGLIAIDRSGNVVLDFNCTGMYRARMDANGEEVAIFR